MPWYEKVHASRPELFERKLGAVELAHVKRIYCGRSANRRGLPRGRLAGWHPVDWAALVLDELLIRTNADPALVDDVLLGCVGQVGEQSSNIARNAVLASKLPQSVPGTTIDRQCGSSQQAIHFAAQAVQSGAMDVVIAAGVMIVNDRGLKALCVAPLARIHHMTVFGHDPVIMLDAPIPATPIALKRAGLKLDEIDLIEVNEAFASVALAWLQTTGADPARMNATGGAIALGHPLGASGAKLMTTLVHPLLREKKRYGLQTMCEGGGMANVTIIERL